MGVDKGYGTGRPVKRTSIPKEYDVTTYLGRSQAVNSSIDAKTARQRQKSFKDLVGPAAGVGMVATTIAGAAAGAPFMPFVAPIAGMAYIASKGKHRAEVKAQKKANKLKPMRGQSGGR
jgi:uncharacterized protein (DUF885 family)